MWGFSILIIITRFTDDGSNDRINKQYIAHGRNQYDHNQHDHRCESETPGIASRDLTKPEPCNQSKKYKKKTN